MMGDETLHGAVRVCGVDDTQTIYQVINESARAYKSILGLAYQEPLMPMGELLEEMERVQFLAYAERGEVLGVMGYEYVGDSALVRHAYVCPRAQRKGVGTLLLRQIEGIIARSRKVDRIIIGTYAKASWAISFYEKHGYVRSRDPQIVLKKYYVIPEGQRVNSLTLEKNLPRSSEN
jgi:GNAT superfamily N-acetyltransferase